MNRKRLLVSECSIDGCNNPAKTRGWCGKHWSRWYTHGDPLWERGKESPLRKTTQVPLKDLCVVRRPGEPPTALWQTYEGPTALEAIAALTGKTVQKRPKGKVWYLETLVSDLRAWTDLPQRTQDLIQKEEINAS